MEKKHTDGDAYLTIQALKRMPYYLQYLKHIQECGRTVVSASAIADELGLSNILVRKDIEAVSSKKGRPRAGFEVDPLIRDIEEYMGCHTIKEAVLVGVGSLGKALLRSAEFEKYGFRIAGAFDAKRSLIHKRIDGVEVMSMIRLKEFCLLRNIRIGIITVPAEAAQSVADELVEGGVQGIWNFALVRLSVPPDVFVLNEDLACSLAMLSQYLRSEHEPVHADSHL